MEKTHLGFNISLIFFFPVRIGSDLYHGPFSSIQRKTFFFLICPVQPCYFLLFVSLVFFFLYLFLSSLMQSNR